MPYVFELANRASSAFSIEARHPFSDRRLVEFCLALPPEQKLHQGWTRMVMRRALAGILPEEVQWRGGKTRNSAAFTYGLLHFEGDILEEVIMNDSSRIEPYVNVAALRETYHRYLSQKDRTGEMEVWHAVTLALWLHYTSLTPRAQQERI
jgi:asparagine synthase (glutamine-hydrolysing)